MLYYTYVNSSQMKDIIAQPQQALQRPQLHVIGAGLARTGTASMKLALEQLYGQPCYHMLENIRHGHSKVWALALKDGFQAHREGILQVLSPYGSAVGFPAEGFCLDLLREFPDAKVILTTRDFDAWYKSCTATVYHIFNAHQNVPFYMRVLMPQWHWVIQLLSWGYWGLSGRFRGKFEVKEFARQAFDSYHQHILSSVPPDRLLVFNSRDGWEPLCRFLNKPVPDQPFPHANDTASFWARVKLLRRVLRVASVVVPVVLVGVPVLGAWLLARWISRG